LAVSLAKSVWPEKIGARNRTRLDRPGCVEALFGASTHVAHLGIGLMDSESRCLSVNGALARETRLTVDEHLGKTPREIVGQLAAQAEPLYEKVLSTGKPSSLWLAGHVRDSVEYGHWFNYCFPIFDDADRVQQLGVFVVNVTAEKESAAIFGALPQSRFLPASTSELLLQLDEAVQGYYLGLELSLAELSCSSREAAKRVDDFYTKLQRLDDEIKLVRELVYTVLAQFRIPSC
jgi:PAS fold